jgi:virulence factor Mce-like protein
MSTQPRHHGLAGFAKAAAAIALIAVAVVLMANAAKSGGSSRRLYVVIPEAAEVIPGQNIRAAGVNVGSVGAVEPVDRGRAARVELDFDSQAWPVPQGSTLALRWGGTVSYSNRYVLLNRAAHGPPIADGAIIPAAYFTLPVEFDTLTRIFTPAVRENVRSMLANAGATFSDARTPLAAAVTTAPPAVGQADALLRSLQENQATLDELVTSADRVTSAVDTADPGLGRLLTGAGATFNAIAGQSANLQATLDRVTPALGQTRTTLVHANTTLTAAGQLVQRLAPGVVQLRGIAAPLSDILTTVLKVGPDARSTLASLGAATPSLNPLLTKAEQLMPTIGSIGQQAVHELQCVRPYTPDIVSLFSNWGDFFSYSDGTDKFARVLAANIPAAPNAAPYDSATAVKLFPGLQYAFPRPPGTAAGEPWFLPQCGAGQDSFDPTMDPEAHG